MEHKPYEGQSPYIFVSYAHHDHKEVMPIIQAMQEEGYRVWYDEGIDPGTEWAEGISCHIDKCDCFIAFLSKQYIESNNCMDELAYARDLTDRRLLIYLRDIELPGGVRMRHNRMQAIYMTHYTQADFLKKLYETDLLENSKGEKPDSLDTTKPGNFDWNISKKIIQASIAAVAVIAVFVGVYFGILHKPATSNNKTEGSSHPEETVEVITLSTDIGTNQESDNTLTTQIENAQPTQQNKSTITPVEIDTPIYIAITEPGEVQYISFTPSASATYYITFTGDKNEPVDTKLFMAGINTASIGGITSTENGKTTIQYFIDGGVQKYCAVAFADPTKTGNIRVLVEKRPIIHSGKCGKDAEWRVVNDTLYVSGKGEMYDYVHNGAPWYDIRHQIKAIVVEDGITSIGSYAFYECSTLTSVTLSETIKTINDSAFSNCHRLPSLTIPEGVEYLGESIVYRCYQLTEINLPSTLMSIGYLGGDCTNLRTITVAPGNKYYSVCDGVLFSSSMRELICHPAALNDTNYTIPDSIITICTYAFAENAKLLNVIIPDSVTTIKSCAFSGCTSLREIVIPDSVIRVEHYAFYGCKNLQNVVLSKNVTSLNQQTFSDCTSLYEFRLPDGFKQLESSGVFLGSYNLRDVYIPTSVEYIATSSFERCPNVTIHGVANSYAQTFAEQNNIPFVIDDTAGGSETSK